MLGIHDYWLFVATGVLLNLTPGQDTLYILGRSIAQGRRIGLASALGISAGSVVHTLAAALGLSAVLATSASAFLVLKVAGALYLVYLGVRVLITRTAAFGATDIADSVDTWTAFRQGMLTNVLNPKVALFFLALMPQFIAPDSPAKVGAFLVLGLTFITTGTAWCLVLALGASRVRRGRSSSFSACGSRQASNDRPHGRLSNEKNPSEQSRADRRPYAGWLRSEPDTRRLCRPGRRRRRQAAGGGHGACVCSNHGDPGSQGLQLVSVAGGRLLLRRQAASGRATGGRLVEALLRGPRCPVLVGARRGRGARLRHPGDELRSRSQSQG